MVLVENPLPDRLEDWDNKGWWRSIPVLIRLGRGGGQTQASRGL